MTWWKKKPPAPSIPPYTPPVIVPRSQAPPAEPQIIVEEVRDPSESAIIRFIHKLKGE